MLARTSLVITRRHNSRAPSARLYAADAASNAANTQASGAVRLKAKRQRAPQPENAEKKPRTYKTDNPEVVKEFFTKLAEELKIAPGEYDKWYSVKTSDVLKRPQGSLILRRNFSGSLTNALRSVHPEHAWEEYRFDSVPSKRFFSKVSNQRGYFDWLARKLDVKSPLEWYNVNWEAVNGRKDIGVGFRQIVGVVYQGQVGKALTKIYPDAGLLAVRFPKLANLVDLNVTINVPEVKSYIEHLAKELHLSKLEHWYYVTLKQMRNVPAYKEIPNRLGGLPAMLVRVYPEHPWDMAKFSFGAHRTGRMGTLKPGLKPRPPTKSSKKADKEFQKEQEREKLSLTDADS